jgi:gas vesicle protein
MWTFIIGFLIGGLIFAVLGFLVGNSKSEETTKSKNKESNYIRRGIWNNGYSVGSGENKKKFGVQFELGEVESTSTKSKVEVISMVSSCSEYNDDLTRKKISDMVNNTWMLSTDIEWIDDTSKMRNDKIEQILNN